MGRPWHCHIYMGNWSSYLGSIMRPSSERILHHLWKVVITELFVESNWSCPSCDKEISRIGQVINFNCSRTRTGLKTVEFEISARLQESWHIRTRTAAESAASAKCGVRSLNSRRSRSCGGEEATCTWGCERMTPEER